MEDSYNYLTIETAGSSFYKVKGSKHLGEAISVRTEDEIKEIIERKRKEHHTANHVCYAWRLGADKALYRANDDGEPSNSAGKPILGQIEKYNLTNVLVTVVRYFGGTKLGVGGLIEAYRTAAAMAIENAEISEKQLLAHFIIKFSYDRMSDVMLGIRTHSWEDYDQNFSTTCSLKLRLKPELKKNLTLYFEAYPDISVQFLGIY